MWVMRSQPDKNSRSKMRDGGLGGNGGPITEGFALGNVAMVVGSRVCE